MLTEIYIEALLVDEELADLVWDAGDAGEIDKVAALFQFSPVASGKSIAGFWSKKL